MEIVFVTGMSGAGKSQAVDYLEDRGYFCMDNVPPYVLPDIVSSFVKSTGTEEFGIEKLAFVVDIRSQEFLDGFEDALKKIEENVGCPYKIIFLEASDSVLISRYQQTRRKHPLAANASLTDAIAEERKQLENIRTMATGVIDTSFLNPAKLQQVLNEMLASDDGTGMSVFIESFGFKYGVPVDCDYVFDARFIPNPYYVPELKNLTGRDKAIADYLEGFSQTAEFVAKTADLIEFTIPNFIREGKGRLHIGIGCTGGRHRSVYCAEKLCKTLLEAGVKATVRHRDVDKEASRYAKKAEN